MHDTHAKDRCTLKTVSHHESHADSDLKLYHDQLVALAIDGNLCVVRFIFVYDDYTIWLECN